jgi:Mg-chelatase subunit ChlD
MLSLFLGACGGGGGSDSGTTNISNETPPAPTPEPTPESKLGVVINSIETDECPDVKVYLSVADADNELIQDDPALAVKLYEDGVEQTNNFSIAWQGDTQSPISVVFALDYSLSMSDSLLDMENGVKAFINAMKPEDKAAIIKFYYAPQLMVGLTSDKTALYNAVDTPPDSDQYTNIYDTVFEAVNVVAGAQGRLAVILLTDGQHIVSSDYQVFHTLEQATENAKSANVSVFSIALDLRDDSEIRYISEETGGIYYPVLDSSVISDVYLSLYELLEKQHLIVYTSSAIDGLEHSIQISAEYSGITGDSIIHNFTACTAP